MGRKRQPRSGGISDGLERASDSADEAATRSLFGRLGIADAGSEFSHESSSWVMSITEASTEVRAIFIKGAFNKSNQAEKLRFWQALCIDLKLVENYDSAGQPLPPNSLTACRKLLQSKGHVNLKDYIQAKKNGTEPKVFKSVKALREYTRNSRRYINRNISKSAWLEPLLRQMQGPFR